MLQRDEAKKVPWWKYALAAAGAVYLVGMAIWAVTALRAQPGQTGPSELALHPERQDEILAQRRADAMKEELGLSAEQAAKLTGIVQEFQQARKERFLGAAETGPLGRMQAMMQLRAEMREKLGAVLSPEQLAQFEEKQEQRIMGAMGAIRSAGLNPMAAGPPRGPGEARERFMNILQPVTPQPAPAAEQ